MGTHFSPIRHRFIALAAAVAALLAVPLGAAPALADPPPPVARYVAVGDSYAAGQGAGSYLDGCLRSPLGYPSLIDAEPRHNLLRQPACSGATIADVMTTQVSEVNRGTTLITVTAGANDLDLAAVFAACAPDPTTLACQQAVASSTAVIPAVGPQMAQLIAELQVRAPDATIVVTGYPVPFASAYAAALPAAAAVNQGALALNAQLAGAVQATAMAGAQVVFAPVSFGDHVIGGSALPWFGADVTDPVGFLHPTAQGYVAYRDAVLAVVP